MSLNKEHFDNAENKIEIDLETVKNLFLKIEEKQIITIIFFKNSNHRLNL